MERRLIFLIAGSVLCVLAILLVLFKGNPEDKVSLSFRFVFRRPDRTLQADEVDAFQQKIIETLRARFRFQLREGGKIDK